MLAPRPLAGANSMFIGDKVLTTPNPGRIRDDQPHADIGAQA